jgi:glutathione synthase/RimK-type ligase-like ATP-grasp enzyme
MKLLRIAILAQLESQTITEQLAPRLQERGHTVDVLNLSEVSSENFIAQPEIDALRQYDIVYYRSGVNTDGSSDKIILLEEFLSENSIKTVNLHYTKHPQANSKTYEIQLAEENGLKTPKTSYSTSTNFETLKQDLGVPFIVKTDVGTNGIGVHLVNNSEEFDQVIICYPETQLIFQEFVPHDFEYRVHMMDGEVVCIYKKAPPEDDFRSNESQGGEMLLGDPSYTKELTKMGRETSDIFNFEIFVADFMLDKNTNEFYFTEINLNPGWEKTDREITGVDVIGLTADYFENRCT